MALGACKLEDTRSVSTDMITGRSFVFVFMFERELSTTTNRPEVIVVSGNGRLKSNL